MRKNEGIEFCYKTVTLQGVIVRFMGKFADVQPQTRQAAHKFGVSLEETASFNSRKYLEES